MRHTRSLLFTIAALALVGVAFFGGYLAGDRRARRAADPGVDYSLLWQVRDLLSTRFLGDMPDAQAQLFGEVRGLVGAYKDPYTVFVEPAPQRQIGRAHV